MKITILGCGNAFSAKNYNQCFLVEEDGRRLLVDYGWQAPNALRAANIPVKAIDDIYISHLHADHIGGLEQMAFMRYDWAKRPRHYSETETQMPRLIANHQLLKDLWDKSLRGGLESMEGFVATLETFFETHPIEDNGSFTWQGWTMTPVQQIHIMSGSMISWTFGLMCRRAGYKTIYFTADSQHCSPKQMELFYKEADLIFQDCECTPFPSGVHAHYNQLAGYPKANSVVLSDEIKAKMWLSHYQDYVSEGKNHNGIPFNWGKQSKEDGFAGFVYVGQEFDDDFLKKD